MLNDQSMNSRADFVVIMPGFIFAEQETGEMLEPVYLRPVNDAAIDFVNAAYEGHKRGLHNSLVFMNLVRFYEALDGLTILGLKVEIL